MYDLQETINKVILLGKKYNNITVQYIEQNHQKMDIDFNQDMQYLIFNNFLLKQLDREPYEDITLTIDELIFLFKGAAVGEVYLRQGFYWACGSVSITTRVFIELMAINYEKAKELHDWAVEYFGLNPELLHR